MFWQIRKNIFSKASGWTCENFIDPLNMQVADITEWFSNFNYLYHRVNIIHYFGGTRSGTSFVTTSLSDMGLSGRKLPTYPIIIATVNANVGNFYVESAIRNSDQEIAIIFNREYSGSFIVGLSFMTEDA